MDMYIYNTDTMELIEIIGRSDNSDCERQASEQYGNTDQYGWTYTPNQDWL